MELNNKGAQVELWVWRIGRRIGKGRERVGRRVVGRVPIGQSKSGNTELSGTSIRFF